MTSITSTKDVETLYSTWFKAHFCSYVHKYFEQNINKIKGINYSKALNNFVHIKNLHFTNIYITFSFKLPYLHRFYVISQHLIK